MPRISLMFLQLGYELFHVPGISRAWRREFADRSYVLITDIGGYDLPEPGGPYSAMHLSSRYELLDINPCLNTTRELFAWIQRLERIAARQSLQINTASPEAVRRES